MRTSRASFAALLILALIAAASFAQDGIEGDVSEVVTGEIKELGVAHTLVVEEAGGRRHVIATNADTTITSVGKKIRYEDLEVGWRVVVDADTREDVAMATSIEVLEAR